MCGILGVIAGPDSGITPKLFKHTTDYLFKLSESRGKESAGLAALTKEAIQVYKSPVPATQMIRTKKYDNIINSLFEDPKKLTEIIALIGHSRLVTNGSEETNENNQPVIKDGVIGIHNGIIVNANELWVTHPELERQYDVDTEVLLSMIRKSYSNSGSIIKAVQYAYSEIQGNAAIALLFTDINSLILATNNGSLYTYDSTDPMYHIFASEKYILKMLASKRDLRSLLQDNKIIKIMPGHGRYINLANLQYIDFQLKPENGHKHRVALCDEPRTILDKSPLYHHPDFGELRERDNDDPSLLFIAKERVDKLRRCSRCILPETFPFIEFDEEGICNYCRNYENFKLLGNDQMENFVAKYRNDNGEPDCLVMISGGRDSIYALHYVKEILGMEPVAYTYDWGMVTDLARRNIARICGKLGIEHILLSADIRKKRANIRKNVLAWLKKPDLGTVPLFMAGDKQYFYYANKIMKQMEIDLVVLSANQYEKTYFKSGFCDVPPDFVRGRNTPSIRDQMILGMYYGRRFLENRAYINNTIIDTVFGLLSYYNIPHNYLRIYDYILWDEQKIMSTIMKKYNWEIADDTKATWRIGDGTAPFYNYIYYTMAGFTENDTFRSNQIREGALSRDEALKLVMEENKPRYEGIRWYLDTIGLGTQFNKIIRTINSAPTVY